MAEHRLCKAGVRGSIPLVSTLCRRMLAECARWVEKAEKGGGLTGRDWWLQAAVLVHVGHG